MIKVGFEINNNPDLTFKDKISQLRKLGTGEWITVFSRKEEWFECTFSALIPASYSKNALMHPSWDLSIGSGMPGFTFGFEKGQEIATYQRFSDKEIEPLVFLRNFYGIKDDYFEISEEFRHYFNFYEDKKNNKYFFIDNNGDEHEAIIIEKDEIRIKSKYLLEFLAVKKMDLALFFDFNQFSKKTLKDLGIKQYHRNVTRKNWCYSRGVRNFQIAEDIKSQGWLMGKKIIHGLKNFAPKMLDKQTTYEKFIIGFKNGKELAFTCNPDKLANYFGKNKGNPHYFTPIFFKKEVLIKYYGQPAKYSVGDGYVTCAGLWTLRIDNNHTDQVMVFLGDLGHLKHNEQLYWKHYAVAKKGKISYTCWARSFEGEFADPERSDLLLKQKFRQFQKEWKKKFGWYLFRPLSQADAYHFKTLRIPLTNEQNEFDDQVLSLTKLLIDSLNEKELAKGLFSTKNHWKGIDKLDAFLDSKKVKIPQMIVFLRNVQDLRSTGVAHLKGKKYIKIKKTFGIDEKELSKVFDDIIVSSIKTLNSLEHVFLRS